MTFAHVARLLIHRRRRRCISIGAATIVLVSRGAINLGFYTLSGFLFFFVHESLRVTGDARTMTGSCSSRSRSRASPVRHSPATPRTASTSASSSASRRWRSRSPSRVRPPTRVAAVAVAAVSAGIAWGGFVTADWAIAYAVLPRTAMAAAMGVWNLTAAIPQVVAPSHGAARDDADARAPDSDRASRSRGHRGIRRRRSALVGSSRRANDDRIKSTQAGERTPPGGPVEMDLRLSCPAENARNGSLWERDGAQYVESLVCSRPGRQKSLVANMRTASIRTPGR